MTFSFESREFVLPTQDEPLSLETEIGCLGIVVDPNREVYEVMVTWRLDEYGAVYGDYRTIPKEKVHEAGVYGPVILHGHGGYLAVNFSPGGLVVAGGAIRGYDMYGKSTLKDGYEWVCRDCFKWNHSELPFCSYCESFAVDEET